MAIKEQVTQTREPIASRTRHVTPDGFHDVLVERDSDKYESPVEDYLAKGSPTDPTKYMYEQVSDDARNTGHRKLLRLRCTQEDYEAMMAENTQLAHAMEAKKAPDEELHRGGVPLQST